MNYKQKGESIRLYINSCTTPMKTDNFAFLNVPTEEVFVIWMTTS